MKKWVIISSIVWLITAAIVSMITWCIWYGLSMGFLVSLFVLTMAGLYMWSHDDTDSNNGTNNKAVKETNNDANDEVIENVLTTVFVGGLVILGFLFGISADALSSSDDSFRKDCYQHNHGYRYSRPKH